MGESEKEFMNEPKYYRAQLILENACKFSIGHNKKWSRHLKQIFQVPDVLGGYPSTYTDGHQSITLTEDM